VSREMSRVTIMGVLALAAFVFGQDVFGQEPLMQSSPELPSGVVGPPLIAWSQTQQPEPIPETVTPAPPDQQQARLDQQHLDQQHLDQQPDDQIVTGTTLKDETAISEKKSPLPNQEFR
jgi:hypothetical protein